MINQHLKEMRLSHQLTLKELSEKSGISIGYLSDIERGRTNPSLKTLQALANTYGLSMDTLLGAMSFDLSPDEVHLLTSYRCGDIAGMMRLALLSYDRLNKEDME
jgi:transcriptional regulator with XRE-family HTH domain